MTSEHHSKWGAVAASRTLQPLSPILSYRYPLANAFINSLIFEALADRYLRAARKTYHEYVAERRRREDAGQHPMTSTPDLRKYSLTTRK